jgi:competence protein ComEC
MTGCRLPQTAQKTSASLTRVPQWLQKGILKILTLRHGELFRKRCPSSAGTPPLWYDFAMRTLWAVALTLASAAALPAAKKGLEAYFIDVEGGQATLIVSPSGESMLIDAGWPGYNGRDAGRIAAAAKAAGVKKIDYLVVTHYHTDHVGGVPAVAEKIPVRNFVDHGASVETGKNADVLMNAYVAHRAKGNHIQVKPGDTIPMKGLDIKVVASGGQLMSGALAGAGAANPACAGFQPKAEDKSENAQSIAMIIGYGKFRMADLADLTWNKEHGLMCPENRLGTVNVYVVTHHGMNLSGPAAVVHALHPQVAIMNNGAKKGGTAEAWQTIRQSPGLADIWQLHYSLPGGKENNAPDTFIANTDEICEGKWIKLTAQQDGSFTVVNARNKFERSYK